MAPSATHVTFSTIAIQLEAGTVLWPLSLLAAGAVGYFLSRAGGSRRRWSPAPLDTNQRFLPDPAIRWLARSHGARGVWAMEGTSDADASIARHVDGAGLSAAELETLEQRLVTLIGPNDEGVERMERGTLVYVSRPAAVAAMLLPPGPPVATDLALDDLRELAGALVLYHALLPTRESRSPVESLAAVGLGLAVQLERLIGGPVAVVVNLQGGPRVVAVSPTGDQRLVNERAESGSPAGKVARGELDSMFTGYDPLGTSVTDRRRSTTAHILPLGPEMDRLGALVVWPRNGKELTGQMLADAAEAARSVKTSLETAKQVHELWQTATTDPLTGLVNRRGLDGAMARIGVDRGALIYADLDKFKNLNDALGHPAGDDALVHFANVIRDHVRATDAAARIGGEEFAIWLPDATVAKGYEIAERIRLSLVQERLWAWENNHWPLTASFGVSAFPETSRSRENLPAQADAALYQAKNAGRNRVIVAGQEGR